MRALEQRASQHALDASESAEAAETEKAQTEALARRKFMLGVKSVN